MQTSSFDKSRENGGVWKKSLLEKLPYELRRHILSMLAIEDLRALVHASPDFHQQYRTDRRYSLLRSLKVSLGRVWVDAYAVHQSSLISFSHSRNNKNVLEFLRTYTEQLGSDCDVRQMKSLSEHDVIDMLKFYHLIKDLIQGYSEWALDNLGEETGENPDKSALSRTELNRLLRAFYRYQLFSNLLGPDRDERYWTEKKSKILSRKLMDVCASIFEPWETEEIICIYLFVEAVFYRVFSKVHRDLDTSDTAIGEFSWSHDHLWRSGRREPELTYSHDVTDRVFVGTVSRGLELLQEVLLTTQDHNDLVAIMQEQIISKTSSNDFFMQAGGVPCSLRQHNVRETWPSDRLRKEFASESLPFRGDEESDDKGPCPPLAWTIIWEGTYSNFYGSFISPGLQRCGYVMWDAARLERSDAKGWMWWERQSHWRYGEPRERNEEWQPKNYGPNVRFDIEDENSDEGSN